MLSYRRVERWLDVVIAWPTPRRRGNKLRLSFPSFTNFSHILHHVTRDLAHVPDAVRMRALL